MTYIPAPPNTNYVAICGYVASNGKRDASCAYEPSTYEQGAYQPLRNGEPGAYEPVSQTTNSTSHPQTSTILHPQISTSSLAQTSTNALPQTSTSSLPQTSISSIAPPKATKPASVSSGSPYTNVQYTNLTVQVGNLFGPDLKAYLSSGLTGICPPITNSEFESCNGKLSKDVEFMVPGDGNYIIQEGSVSFGIPLSNYSSTANRDGMIAVLAAFLESMATNGTANCQTNTSEWEDDECEPGSQRKREEGPGGSGSSPVSLPGFKCKRVVTMTYCQVPNIVQLEITEDNVVTEYMVSWVSCFFILWRRECIISIRILSPYHIRRRRLALSPFLRTLPRQRIAIFDPNPHENRQLTRKKMNPRPSKPPSPSKA